MVSIDDVGALADKADNLVQASSMPLPAEEHVGHLVAGLRQISAVIKQYVVEQTGDDPWE